MLGSANLTSTPLSKQRSHSPSNKHSHSHSTSHSHSPRRSIATSTAIGKRDAVSGLHVAKVIGTTATSHANFSLVGDSLAYSAGAGAVLKNLITNTERFFCTSTRTVQSIQQTVASAASVPTWIAENTTPTTHGLLNNPRDSNGYPLGTETGMTSLGINSQDLSNLASTKLSTPAKDKMKSASCVALSFDAGLLAVGETGHQPRVFIYSTAVESSTSTPLAILCEHRYGVKSVAFSPCGKYLASLGTANDGFLHIWQLNLKDGNGVALHSSNRCISSVNDMKWIGSGMVITVGVRHVRIWRVDHQTSSNQTWVDTRANVLSGRNLVLGEFSASNFVGVVAVGTNLAIISTDRGEIATIEEKSDEEKLEFVSRMSANNDEVACMDVDLDTKELYTAGSIIQCFPLAEVLSATSCTKPVSPSITRKPAQFRAIGCRPYGAVTLTASRDIIVNENGIVGAHAQDLKGTRRVGTDRFLTWSTDGVVRVWDSSGTCQRQFNISLDNDLTMAYLTPDGDTLICGDKYGTVLVGSGDDDNERDMFVAHGSSVSGIDYAKTDQFEIFITCSRDRTIQVFMRVDGTWTLHQTLPAHKSTIHAAYFTADGQRIVSCSADRTVAVHNIITNDEGGAVFVSEKVISLKSTPLDMALDPTSERIVVSADKHIMIYRLTGEFTSSYRCLDEGDAVSLSAISMGTMKDGSVYLAGVGQDKGIRVYDHSTGLYLGTDWGHAEGVSGITWILDRIVSTGLDGCIFMWGIDDSNPFAANEQITSQSPSPMRTSPTRKFLSKQELAKFLPSTPSPTRNKPANSASNRPPLSTTNSAPVQSRRKSLHPSKSMCELKPVKPQTDRSVSPTSEMMRIEEEHSSSSSCSGRSAGSMVTRKKPADVDDVCQWLAKFRDTYKKQKPDQVKVEKLKQELKSTLVLLDGKATERAKMDEMLEQFGDRLVSLVESKLDKL